MSDPIDGGLKDVRDEENILIISDSTLRSLLPPQLNKMSLLYKVVCDCICCTSAKSIHPSLLSWSDRYFKN